jgi:rubrerythrin
MLQKKIADSSSIGAKVVNAEFVAFTEYKWDSNYKNNDNQKNFLICESCYWCASSTSISINHHIIKKKTISKCPVCYNDEIIVIPILRGLHV